MTINNGIAALSNRRGFISLSQHAFSLCQRHKNSASLIYLNHHNPLDRQPTEEGRAAVAFAKLLGSNFRATDVVGQLAHSEFAVFLANADNKSATISLRRFKNLVDEYNQLSKEQPLLTYSAGIERVDFEHHQNIDDLLAQSDSNLYRHRQARKKQPEA